MSKSQRSSRFIGVRFALAAVICGLVFTVASFHTQAADFPFIHFVGEFLGLQNGMVESQEPNGSNVVPITEPTVVPITEDPAQVELKRKLISVRGGKAQVSEPAAQLAPNANAIRALSGCTANTLPANDDGSSPAVTLPFTINYFGRTFTQTFVNNNGNITFTAPLGTFTPFALTTTNTPIIAPFFADVDTRGMGSGLVQYGNTTLDSRTAFCANWVNVGYYSSHADLRNSFQLILIDRTNTGPGNFDIEFNYDRIVWETGDASGGTGGQGGSSARAGYANGTTIAGTFLELPGSAVNGGLKDSNPTTGLTNNSRNSGPVPVLGRYIFTSSVELLGFEVTQAVQDLGNNVPLVAGKRTFIRAYIKPTAAASGATMSAFLTGTNSGGVTNGRLSPSNPGGTVRVLDNLQRSVLLDSFYFELPPDWIKAGTLQFRIESPDASIICHEPDSVPDCSTTVTFRRMQKLSINLIGVTWTDASGVVHTPTLGDSLQAFRELQARLPMYEFEAETSTTTITDNPCTAALGDILAKINNLRTQDIANGKAAKRYYMGLMPDQSSCGPNFRKNGIAYCPGRASLIFTMRNGIMDGNSRAHELEHNTGIKHTASGAGELFPAADYLPADGRISTGRAEYGANTAYGFDINNSNSNRDGARIFLPSTYDSMSYQRPRWISVFNYNKLFTTIGVVPPGGIPEIPDPAAVMVAQSVTVSGNISPPPEVGTLDPLFVKNTNGVITLPDPGSYEIRFENAAGQLLATYSFDPLVDADGDSGKFALVLPWNPDARRIRLLHNSQELVSRQATTNTPTVTVTSPNGGETLNGPTATFTWTAADADGNALTYVVDYSSDAGTTWNTLTSGVTTTSYTADVTKLRASNQALVRVSASDGFNSAQDQSNAVFTVSEHAPEVSISTPLNNDLYVGDQMIILDGMGLDIEDGILDGSRLSWSSNLNGPLGTGNSLAINASTLLEGTHTITLTASDSTSRTGTATISIRVFRNRPVFPAMLSVGPTNLAFNASMGTVQSASQTIAIRNSGDGVITWSATADQPWIRLNSAGGTAPSNLAIMADPAGLAIGQFTGRITVTSPGTANSPQIVQVIFSVTQPVPVTVSGRVLTSDGRGLRNATASITDSNGVVRTTTTSSFGFYSFDNVLTGGTYTVRVFSRLYRFAPRTVPVGDNLANVDFMGLE